MSDTTDDNGGDFSDLTIDERIETVIDRLEATPNDAIATVGVAVILKGDGAVIGDDDEKTVGFSTTIFNENLEGYHDAGDVVACVWGLNERLDDAKIDPKAAAGRVDRELGAGDWAEPDLDDVLESLFGGEGGDRP